jgi:homoserine kinase type II
VAAEAASFPVWLRQLPRGIVHGDLFIDNVRYSCGKLCGVLDFEMACSAPLVYDLAVALGDWGFLHDRFMPERARALLLGYQRKRALKGIEKEMLYAACRFSAARFAVTRYYDFEVNRRPEAQRAYKDYRHFMDRLQSLLHVGEKRFNEMIGTLEVAPLQRAL